MTRLPLGGVHPSFALSCAALFLTTACSSPEFPTCTEWGERVADDQTLPFGFTVDDVLAVAHNTATTAGWTDGATAGLSFSISREPDSACWVESEPSALPEAIQHRQAPDCYAMRVANIDRPHLRVPMRLHMQTDDGRLAGSIPAVASAYTYPDDPVPSFGVVVDLPLSCLDGPIDIEAAIGPLDADNPQLLILGEWDEFGPSGVMEVYDWEGYDWVFHPGPMDPVMFWGPPPVDD